MEVNDKKYLILSDPDRMLLVERAELDDMVRSNHTILEASIVYEIVVKKVFRLGHTLTLISAGGKAKGEKKNNKAK